MRPGAPRVAATGLAVAALLFLPACLGVRRSLHAAGPGAVVLDGVPRTTFGTDRCGSGALSSVLAFYGDAESQSVLDATLPKSADGGVLSVDLLLAARDRGYPARLAPGTAQDLEAAIRRGQPPVLMLRIVDVPGQRRDLYHYVVVDGVDREHGLVRLLLGDGQARWVPTTRLERPWRGAGHAMLLVQRRHTSNGLSLAVDLERQGRLAEAAQAYRSILENAPSATVWTNLGNVESARERPAEAEAAYRRALDLSPEDPDALANLAWLRLLQGRAAEAEDLASRAALASGDVRGLALDTVGRARLALGRCAEAADAFRVSLSTLAPGDPARAGTERGLQDAAACSP